MLNTKKAIQITATIEHQRATMTSIYLILYMLIKIYLMTAIFNAKQQKKTIKLTATIEQL